MRTPTAVLALVLAAGCSAGEPRPAEPTTLTNPSAGSGTSGSLPVQRFEDLPYNHVDGPVEYEQVPPVGGPHNDAWLACGAYGEPVPPEAAVHSLQHGAVWITYQPDLAAEGVERLRALTRLEEEYVLVSPFEGLPAPVVASAWGLQLTVDAADDGRLQDFVRTYAGGDQGGEPGAPCRSGGVGLEQARAAVGGG